MHLDPAYHHTDLEKALVGRADSFFSQDMEAFSGLLRDSIKGSRILMIGAAGSIGSETLKTILRFEPAGLHVVDHHENGLAELVRGLRSADELTVPDDFLMLPFDYGGPVFRQWFKSLGQTYDHVLNFAALKHVRSEKDPYSILAMLETNVHKLLGLMRLLEHDDRVKRLFCVSTDKAANPSSMMGATKRMMEHALFLKPVSNGGKVVTASARFANVAMSNGSLLQAWQNRLQARQPLSCPKECRRYFVSLRESGHLCTLAAFAGQANQVFIPTLDPETNLVRLEDTVANFLKTHDLEPLYLEDEADAKAFTINGAGGKYPVLLTPLDTAGEKPYEEFLAKGETLQDVGIANLRAVTYLPPRDPEAFESLVQWLDSRLSSGTGDEPLSIAQLQRLIGLVEPEFMTSHRHSPLSLDKRM